MKLKHFVALTLLATLSMVACEKNIPIKELSKAKDAIDRALSVKADQYSPAELQEASLQIIKAHELLIKDEKSDEAVKSADISYNKAVEAYDKAVVLYAADMMKKADAAIAGAETVYAEKFSPDNFSQSKDLYRSANEKFSQKDYLTAYKLAEDSYKKAVKAKEESLDNKYQLQARIDEVKSTLNKVSGYDYQKYAGDQYNLAAEKLSQAEKDYSSDSLKSGFASIDAAKINADQAYKLTMDGTAGRKVGEAEQIVTEADNFANVASVREDLAAAKEALNNAKTMKNNGSYDESMTYANEAIRLGNKTIEEGRKAAIAVASANKTDQKGSTDDKNAADQKDKSADTKAGADKTVASKTESDDSDPDFYHYKVKSWEKYRDCLWRIAGKYYNNPRLWGKIYKANRKKIGNPNVIQPGWILNVPKIKK